MKIIGWNVNGLRSVLRKDKTGADVGEGGEHVLEALVREEDPDILALQETRCPAGFRHGLEGRFAYHKILEAAKKGYSGVAVFSKQPPLRELTDFEHNEEGRCIALEYEGFYLINTYTPNAQKGLTRLEYRVSVWEAYVRGYVGRLQEQKPVVFVSDLNCAPTELDIYRAKGHEKAPCFSKEEREAYHTLLRECRLVNAFRHVRGEERKYTWFSNFAKSRERNAGWTLDHTLVSETLVGKIADADVLSDYYGSDHCPVMLRLDL